MKVTINSKETQTQAQNVQQLADELCLGAAGVAIAISNKMVPRSQWAGTALQEGAEIVIIRAACGG